MKYTNSMLANIGNTPLMKLNKVARDAGANVYAKLEYLNPSGSYKDRMALSMVDGAEQRGRLRPGGTILEVTSTNTGPALAMVGAVKGYRVVLRFGQFWLRDDTRLRIVRAFGPEVTAGTSDIPAEILRECANETERTVARWLLDSKHMEDLERSRPNTCWVDQMNNPDNPKGQMSMGKEIVEQLDGKVDAFVASIGSAGCIAGVTMALRQEGINAVIIGGQPEDLPIVDLYKDGIVHKFTKLVGMKTESWVDRDGNVERALRMGIPDEVWTVKDDDARAVAYRLAQEEGIFCGMSSGANVYMALKLAKTMRPDQNIVAPIVDRRDRYLGEAPKEHYVT